MESEEERKRGGLYSSGKLAAALLAGIFLAVTVAREETSDAQIIIENHKQQTPKTNAAKVRRIHTLVSGPASGYRLHGVDVSRYQRLVGWQSIKDAGVTFAFIKATEGVSMRDSFFETNWSEASSTNITRGAYHFFIAEKDARVQAVNFILSVKLNPGDLPPVLDVETSRGQTGEQIRGGMRRWLAMVEKAYGVKPIIYSNPVFYNQYLGGYFDEYPFWIASYAGKKKKLTPPEINWQFWQHTDVGKLDGIAKEIDLNVFHGDSSQFLKLTIPAEPKKELPAFRVPS
jgi:lysozyme